LDTLYAHADNAQDRQKIGDEIRVVKALKDDALLLRTKISERIDKIDGVLPRTSREVDSGLIKQALILELLVNRPKLYTDNGRPYRAPWTTRNTNYVLSVLQIAEQPGMMKIKFSEALPRDILAMLKRQGNIDVQVDPTGKTAIIAVQDLRALNEMVLFPELQGGLIANKDYLSPDDTQAIQSAYGIGHRDRIIDAIQDYRLDRGAVNTDAKLASMQETEQALKAYIDTAKDKGFGMHILKKFYFDVQQLLQNMMPVESRPGQINEAFSAALKLDQVSQFNRVVQEAVRQNKITDPAFLGFLDTCIDKVTKAKDHFGACALSAELAAQADVVMLELQRQLQQQLLVQALQVGEDEEDLLSGVDPVEEWVMLQDGERVVLEQGLRVLPEGPDVKDDPSPAIDIST
jgi:hypothetical protein